MQLALHDPFRALVHRCFRIMLFCCLAWVLPAAEDLEAKVKAAYVYHFLSFVDWPPRANEASNAPFRLGLVGQDAVTELLLGLSGKSVRGRPLIVEKWNRSSPPHFHLLYIAQPESKQVSVILKQIQGSDILTVSSVPRFIQEGGMIGFIEEGGKIKIEIGLGSTKQAGLKASAKLLEIARVRP